MKHQSRAALTALALAFAPVGAMAATVGDVVINSVTGVWTATTGTSADGLGTNEITWGVPTSNAGQSGYRFDGAAPPVQGPFAADTVFHLGTFTHFNKPIFEPSITSATLQVTTTGTVDGDVFSVISAFVFDHFETPNDASPCAADGTNPCPDRVTPTLNVGASTSVNVGGVNYFIAVTGFDVGPSFLTLEDAVNTAALKGTFTARVPDPGVVPLPASALLLLAGLGGLAALRRRRAAA